MILFILLFALFGFLMVMALKEDYKMKKVPLTITSFLIFAIIGSGIYLGDNYRTLLTEVEMETTHDNIQHEIQLIETFRKNLLENQPSSTLMNIESKDQVKTYISAIQNTREKLDNFNMELKLYELRSQQKGINRVLVYFIYGKTPFANRPEMYQNLKLRIVE